MQILQETQEKYGYLPLELQGTIADELGIPLTEVYGVATFYSQFTLKPKGKFKIGICLGTACYVRGAQPIIDKVTACWEPRLAIPPKMANGQLMQLDALAPVV